MEQQHQQVREWLEKLYGKDGIPEYEINSRTIAYLLSLAKHHEMSDQRAELIIQDLEQKALEYAEEAMRLRSILDGLGCSFDHLTPEAHGCVENLASIATLMNLRDCSDTSYCLALTELSQEMASINVKMEQISLEMEHEQECMRKELLKEANHTRVLNEVVEQKKEQEPLTARRKKETQFLKQKTEQYCITTSTLQEELKENGYISVVSHRTLQLLAKDIEGLQSEITPLKALVARYQALPPDLALASIKVEEARQKLAKLEAELSRTIDLIHVEK